jgi:hypothetical protein
MDICDRVKLFLQIFTFRNERNGIRERSPLVLGFARSLAISANFEAF